MADLLEASPEYLWLGSEPLNGPQEFLLPVLETQPDWWVQPAGGDAIIPHEEVAKWNGLITQHQKP